MSFLPLRLVFGWLLLVGPIHGWSQGVLHPVNSGYTGPPLADLTAHATAIFEGKAVAYRSFWTKDRSAIYTVATVEVYKVFKGTVAGTVEVATFGGTMPDGAMGLVDGAVPIGNNATGMFFARPFHDAAYTPAVPAGQVYQVVFGQEGLFLYSGLPPQPDAADTPWLRYAPVETALYPLLTGYIGTAYRVLRPFDVRTYDFLRERRGQALRPQAPAHGPEQSPCLSRKYGSSVTAVVDGGSEEPYDSLRVYTYVRQMPSVPGSMGSSPIYEMLQCLLVIPAEVRTGRVEGMVYVNFTVERSGVVSGARIQQGLSPACDAEALAAVARLPRLEPGRLRGRPVAVAFVSGLAFWGPGHFYANWEVAHPARFPAPGIDGYVYKNRRVPAPKRQRGSPQVRVDFVVGANGRVREVRVSQSVSPRFDREALRLVQAMPRWTPARTYQGDAVAVRTELVLVVPAPAPKPSH